jgi:AraC-like DNA-binding protein
MSHPFQPLELLYHQWKSFRANLDWITNATAEKGPSKSYHNVLSPHYIATWVRQGSIKKKQGVQTIRANSGEWLFQGPGENVITTILGETQFMEVGFSIEWEGGGSLYLPTKLPFWKAKALPELEAKTLHLYQYTRTNGPKVAWDYNMRRAKTPLGTYLRYHHLFFDWLATWEELLRSHGHGWQHAQDVDEKMLNAIRYLEEHPFHSPISVHKMAKALSLSTAHCIQLFRQTYHTTPKAYRMSLKLKRALHDLETTRKEIKEIATSLGYSQSWFSIWIKRETGLTPREVRANKGVFHQN